MTAVEQRSTVDLNADLGEGFGRWELGDDEALLGLVTSANIACGFHAGDPLIMRRVCGLAVERGVRIGAQVGYRDLAGFGRRRIDIEPDELRADVLYQLGALQAFAHAAGDQVRYLKPHGALYNTAVTDPRQAGAIVAAVLDFDPALPVLTLPGSALAIAAAERDLPVFAEAFPDRGYAADGTLTPRSEAGALISGAEMIAARAVRMVIEKRVTAVDGTDVELTADSLCLHGDSPSAVAAATAVRRSLAAAGIDLAAFG